MKNNYFILFTLFASIFSHAQTPTIQWQKTLGGSSSDFANSIQQTTDGGYIVAGGTTSDDGDVTENQLGSDYWIVKLSSTGTIQWQKTVGGAGDDIAQSIQISTDGGYIVAGYTNSNNGDVTGIHGNGSYDYWVVKLSSTGAIQWEKTLGGTSNDFANSIQQTTDGGYIVTGVADSNDGDVTENHSNGDYWVLKLSATGTIQWQKTLGGTSSDSANSIQQTTDGGYIVAGYSASNDGDVTENHGNYDYWVVKLSATGTIQWQKTLGGIADDRANSIRQASDGSYTIAGYTYSNDGDVTGNHGDADYWIVKLSETGTILWQKTLGGTANEVAYSVQQTTEGGYVVAGYTDSNDENVTGNHSSTSDYWVVKLSATGTIQWQKTLGGISTDYAYSTQQTTDGGYIVAGYAFSNSGDVTGSHGLNDYWIVKLSPDALSTSFFSKNDLIVFPNPTTSTLTLQNLNNFTIDKIIISDLTGKTVKAQTANSATINVENLAQGMYILEAYSHEQKLVSKFVKE